MATLATQAINRAGLVPALTAAAGGGDKFTPDKHTVLVVNNGSGSSVTVTVASPGNNPVGLANPDVTVTVAAGTTAEIGPFPAEFFADPSDGMAHVSYSAATSVTVGVKQVTQP